MPKLFKETKLVLMPTAAIAIAKEYSAIDLIILIINLSDEMRNAIEILWQKNPRFTD